MLQLITGSKIKDSEVETQTKELSVQEDGIQIENLKVNRESIHKKIL